MKKVLIVLIAVLATSLSFGQMKYQPKVVVILLGSKNATLDESNFPDLHIYYTPELSLKTSAKASKNVNKNAWSSALGVGRTAGKESHDAYMGKPQELVNKGVSSGTAFIFDKNGRVNAETFNGKQEYFNTKTKFLVKFNKLKRSWESETFGDLMKSLVKKGNTIKPAKTPKKPLKKYAIGHGINDFKVSDKDGNLHSIQSLVKGNPATLVLFLYINPEYDLNKGKESGADKKGKDYMNQVAQTMAADKQIAPLYNLEKGIFGKRLDR